MNIGLTSFFKGGIVAQVDVYCPDGVIEDGKTRSNLPRRRRECGAKRSGFCIRCRDVNFDLQVICWYCTGREGGQDARTTGIL